MPMQWVDSWGVEGIAAGSVEVDAFSRECAAWLGARPKGPIACNRDGLASQFASADRR